MNVQGDRTFAAPRATVWEVLNDPARMAQTMPGVESFDVHDDRRWTANVKIPLGLGGLKMKVDMEKTEERELEFAQMSIKGTGVGALLSMETSFSLADASSGETAMHWSAEVKIAGPVGSMGQRVLQPIVNQQVQNVLGALDRQVQQSAGSAAGAPAAGSGDPSPSVAGTAGHEQAPSPAVDAVPAEGPKDYGEPAESSETTEPPTGSSGAEEGTSPWSPDAYDGPDTEPAPSTESDG